MRIHGLIVAKNEADRYLRDSLTHARSIFDTVHLFDDQSTDGTLSIARELGCTATVRKDNEPSFLEHEGRFREAAWDSMELKSKPQKGDWVFVFDADEFVVSSRGARPRLEAAIIEAHIAGCDSIRMPIIEIFGTSPSGVPMQRTDGYWPRIDGVRLGRYQRLDSSFRDKSMGCGVLPSYSFNPLRVKDDLFILHYGYAIYEDRCAKYDRYKSMKDHGHNPAHIDSIMREPTLIGWKGPVPQMGVNVEG